MRRTIAVLPNAVKAACTARAVLCPVKRGNWLWSPCDRYTLFLARAAIVDKRAKNHNNRAPANLTFNEFEEPLSGELSASPQARRTGRYPS